MQPGESSDQICIQPNRVKKLLSQWFTTRHASSVTLKENTEPKSDVNGDYSIVYEAIFEPDSLDQARVEVWVTKQGCIAIGLEKQKRIAKRLGVNFYKDRFAAGHEPSFVSESSLLCILELIADGKIGIASFVIPLVGLISTHAVATKDTVERLILTGYPTVNWIKVENQSKLLRQKHRLDFRPWN